MVDTRVQRRHWCWTFAIYWQHWRDWQLIPTFI